VINASGESAQLFSEALLEALLDQGYAVAVGSLGDFVTGRSDFLSFLKHHDPQVLLFDIALPYAENWHLVHQLLGQPAAQGRTLVLITTGKAAVERLVAGLDHPTVPIEIIDKPFDLAELLDTVSRPCAASRDSSEEGGDPWRRSG
jgi:DNA-binding response OmpR family regulator